MKKFLIVLTFCCLFLFGCSSNVNSLNSEPTLSEEDLTYIKNKFSNFSVDYNAKENSILLIPDEDTKNLLNYYLNNGDAGAITFDPNAPGNQHLFGYEIVYDPTPKSLKKSKELAIKGLNDPEARRNFITFLMRIHKTNFNHKYYVIYKFCHSFNLDENHSQILLDYLSSGNSPYIAPFDNFVSDILSISQRFTDKYNKDLTFVVKVEDEKVAEVSGNYVTYNKLDDLRDLYNFDINRIISFADYQNNRLTDSDFELDNIDTDNFVQPTPSANSIQDALQNGGSLLKVFSEVGVNEYKKSNNSNIADYKVFNKEVATGDPYYIFDRVDEIMSVEPNGDSTKDLIEFSGLLLKSLDNTYSEFLTLVAENDSVKNKYLNEFKNARESFAKDNQTENTGSSGTLNYLSDEIFFTLNDLSRNVEIQTGGPLDLDKYDIEKFDTSKYIKTNIPYFNFSNDKGVVEENISSQDSPYRKGQKLIVNSDKAYNRSEPQTNGKKVGYWIRGDEVTVYDFTYFDDRWWIKTSPDKEWWVSERDLEVID
ncbi:SH3 domain-containing protein [Peptoniphilus hominis (ex Hitch et al. 2025)]|uniref:SH3 domain-containing protein n=1 Tax=Peptoniphilus hominis (ex Hitch et al. 2025) TaxID=3133174 RepID=A0ABV1CII8_9FIRM